MQRNASRIQAYAKLNLRLEVRGRRSDGYHLLRMVNCLVDLSDTLELIRTEKPCISIEVESVEMDPSMKESLQNPSSNLIGKAYHLVNDHYQLSYGVSVKLQKKIPLGGGVGGGSSDAAAALRFLMEDIREKDGSTREDLALLLGADVPYFLKGGLSLVEGIGEKIRPLHDPGFNHYPVILVLPCIGTATAEVYRRYAAHSRKRESNPDEPIENLCASWKKLVNNDLEPAILEVAPFLSPLMARLREIPSVVVSFSGSGSTIFVIPEEKEGLDKAMDEVRAALMGRDARMVVSRLLTSPAIE